MKFTKLVSSFAIGFLSLGLVHGVRAQVGPINAPINAGNLVNVSVTDVLTGNTVIIEVPIGIALNLCNTTVAVLSDTNQDGKLDCKATTTSFTGPKK